jgi:hypothetical protein
LTFTMPVGSGNEGHISDLKFDQWRAGELSADQIGSLEQHLADCDRCRGRCGELEAQARAFLDKYPRWDARPRGARPAPARFRVVMGAWSAAIGLAAAGLLLWLGRTLPDAGDDVGSTRVKGGHRIGFFVKHGDHVTPGADGQVVHPGDALRFTVSLTNPSHFAILSLDGTGVASIYYPTGTDSEALGVVREMPLDSSVTLDDTLGKEQLLGVFCEEAFELEPLRSALEQGGRLPELSRCTVDSLTIVKVAP